MTDTLDLTRAVDLSAVLDKNKEEKAGLLVQAHAKRAAFKKPSGLKRGFCLK